MPPILKKTGVFTLYWLFIFAISLLMRIPYFTGNHFFIDGDEAIIGIMTSDFIHGKNIPWYFYGQQYGFSFFEVLAATPFMWVLGQSIWTLKLGALLLFSLGITFIIKSLHTKYGSVVWLLLPVFCMFPSWWLWGSMLRGGYLTAFTSACAIVYILFLPGKKTWHMILVGVLSGISIAAQPLIFLSVVFFLVRELYSRSSVKTYASYLISVIVVYFVIQLPSFISPSVWQKPGFNTGFDHWSNAFMFFTQHYWAIFSNSYYYEMVFNLPLWWKIILILFHILLLIVLVKALKNNKRIAVLWLTTAIILWALPCINALYTPRYLLGFTTFLLFSLYMAVWQNKSFIRPAILLGILILPGLLYLPTIHTSWYLIKGSEKKNIEECIQYLEQNQHTHVFCTDVLLQWQLNYLGNQRIFVRSAPYPERTLFYADKVNEAWLRDSTQCVVAGMNGICMSMDSVPGFNTNVIKINEKYFVMPLVKKEYLQKGGFILPQP